MKQFLTAKLHVSWLVAVSFLGLSIGVIVAGMTSIQQFVSIAWLLIGVLLCTVSWRRQRRYAAAIAIVGGILVGLWRGGTEQTALSVYQSLIGKSIELRGTLSDDIGISKKGEAVLRVKQVHYAGHELTGTIWVTTDSSVSIKRSDRVTLKGRLSKGFGTFGASMYDGKVVHIMNMNDPAVATRDWFTGHVHSAVAEPEASLGIGYLVG